MIRNFDNKDLETFFLKGKSAKIGAAFYKRLKIRLDRLNQVTELSELPDNWDCHQLSGNYEGYYAISVSGAWRLIFRFEEDEFCDVDFVQYH